VELPVNVGDRIRTPAGCVGTIVAFPSRQGYKAALVKFDPGQPDVALLECVTYPQSLLTVIGETDEHADE
jgi:hypothetical protein